MSSKTLFVGWQYIRNQVSLASSWSEHDLTLKHFPSIWEASESDLCIPLRLDLSLTWDQHLLNHDPPLPSRTLCAAMCARGVEIVERFHNWIVQNGQRWVDSSWDQPRKSNPSSPAVPHHWAFLLNSQLKCWGNLVFLELDGYCKGRQFFNDFWFLFQGDML